MESVDGAWIARAGKLCTWVFAALLAYATLVGDKALLEGVTWQRLLVTAAFGGACAAYLIWLLASLRSTRQEATSFWRALAPAWPAFLVALITPPISRDPHLYLHYGWLVLSGMNPYLEPSSALDGPYSEFILWDMTCAYGPLSLGLFTLGAMFRSHVTGILFLKVLWLGAHIGTAYACWYSRRSFRTLITQAVAFNPILVFAHVLDVHVDALVGLLFLWGLVALAHERPRLSLALFCAATLAKSVALLALPLWFAWALSRRRYRLAAFGASVLSALVALLYLTLLPQASAWLSMTNPISQTAKSIHHALAVLGPHFGLDGERLSAAYGSFARAVYALFAASIWLRAVRTAKYRASQLASDAALLLLVACLFVVPFVPWWYSSLVLSVSLWSPHAVWLRAPAMAFAICSALTLGVGAGPTSAGAAGALLGVVPPALVLAWSAAFERSRRRKHVDVAPAAQPVRYSSEF